MRGKANDAFCDFAPPGGGRGNMEPQPELEPEPGPEPETSAECPGYAARLAAKFGL